MDEKLTKEKLKKLGQLRMAESRRARMREELDAFADFHPAPEEAVRVEGEERLVGRAPKTLGASLVAIFSGKHSRPMIAAALITVLVSGSTAFAAQGSLPGDLLYPVKIHVNENVRSAVVLSSEAEARLQAALMEERLEEAQRLAAEGKLDSHAAAMVSSNIQTRYERATKATAALEAKGNAEAAADIRAKLDSTLRTYTSLFSETDVEARNEGAAGISAGLETLIGATATSEGNIHGDGAVEVNGGTNVNSSLDLGGAGVQINTEAQGQTGSNSASGSGEGSAEHDSSTSIDTRTRADVEADTSIQTGVVDVEADADVEAGTGVNVGL